MMLYSIKQKDLCFQRVLATKDKGSNHLELFPQNSVTLFFVSPFEVKWREKGATLSMILMSG